jgi:hypothetical protein
MLFNMCQQCTFGQEAGRPEPIRKDLTNENNFELPRHLSNHSQRSIHMILSVIFAAFAFTIIS